MGLTKAFFSVPEKFGKNILFLRIFILLAVAAGGFFVSVNFAKADDIFINEDTVWNDGQVIVASGTQGIVIYPGAMLTINAGAIVKFSPNTGFLVAGNLLIKGEAQKPVIITSIKDDTAGGDSNGDGTSTSPAPGDWFGLIVNNPTSTVDMDYAQIKYGGGYSGSESNLISAAAAQEFVIKHSSIIDDEGVIFINNVAVTSITDSNLYNPDFCQEVYPGIIYCGLKQLENSGDNIVEATGNFWGHPDGPTYNYPPLLTDLKGTLILPDGAPVNYEPFATSALDFSEPDIEPSSTPTTTPTTTPETTTTDPVILIPGIMGSWEVGGRWLVDPILHTYDDLWEALKAAGYKEGETLFAFPYQWRDSNTTTAELLKDKIAAVKNICHCNKVDLIGHSMGGLVARAYIEEDDYQNDVDQVIFLATPHRGAAQAYLMWEGGSFGTKERDLLMQGIFSLEAEFNGYGNILQYIHNRPVSSVQELLAIYDYLRDKDTGILRSYPDDYPRNEFLENLNSTDSLAKLNQVSMTNFIAHVDGSSTIDKLRVVSNTNSLDEWENGYPENYDWLWGDHGLEYDAGDTTVPARSNMDFDGSANIIINSDHGQIVTDAQKQVIKILTGKEPETEIHKDLITKLLLIRIFSPADFQVIAPDGKKLGRDFSSSSTFNEINEAFYSGSADGPEFAVIPNPLDGQYQVKLEGTGNGDYRLSASYIDDSTSTNSDISGRITAGEIQKAQFVYANNPAGPISNFSLEQENPPSAGGNYSGSISSGSSPINKTTTTSITSTTDIVFKVLGEKISATSGNDLLLTTPPKNKINKKQSFSHKKIWKSSKKINQAVTLSTANKSNQKTEVNADIPQNANNIPMRKINKISMGLEYLRNIAHSIWQWYKQNQWLYGIINQRLF